MYRWLYIVPRWLHFLDGLTYQNIALRQNLWPTRKSWPEILSTLTGEIFSQCYSNILLVVSAQSLDHLTHSILMRLSPSSHFCYICLYLCQSRDERYNLTTGELTKKRSLGNLNWWQAACDSGVQLVGQTSLNCTDCHTLLQYTATLHHQSLLAKNNDVFQRSLICRQESGQGSQFEIWVIFIFFPFYLHIFELCKYSVTGNSNLYFSLKGIVS